MKKNKNKKFHEFLFAYNILSSDENLFLNAYVQHNKKVFSKNELERIKDLFKEQHNVKVVNIVNIVYVGRNRYNG